jgi:hypothetical protein
VPILTRFAYCSPQLGPLPRGWAEHDGMTSRARPARGAQNPKERAPIVALELALYGGQSSSAKVPASTA